MRVEENAANANARYDEWQNVFENNEKWLSYKARLLEGRSEKKQRR